MDRVFSFGESPLGERQWVVVAIGEPKTDQRHIGVLYRDQNSGLQLLHLAWHCDLRNDAELPNYMVVWIELNVPVRRQKSVAAFCRRIWRKNGEDRIPYAFSRAEGSIDAATGESLMGPSRFGLTCASFVLALFAAAGLPLAEYATWPVDREGDREWQQSIIGKLEGRASQEHLDHLRGEIGTVRFRPEEVAACGALAPPKATFEQAEELGSQIVERIQSRT